MHLFDLYFSGIVAFQYHPANPPKTRMSLDECAEIAARCVEVRSRFFDSEGVWLGLQERR